MFAICIYCQLYLRVIDLILRLSEKLLKAPKRLPIHQIKAGLRLECSGWEHTQDGKESPIVERQPWEQQSLRWTVLVRGAGSTVTGDSPSLGTLPCYPFRVLPPQGTNLGIGKLKLCRGSTEQPPPQGQFESWSNIFHCWDSVHVCEYYRFPRPCYCGLFCAASYPDFLACTHLLWAMHCSRELCLLCTVITAIKQNGWYLKKINKNQCRPFITHCKGEGSCQPAYGQSWYQANTWRQRPPDDTILFPICSALPLQTRRADKQLWRISAWILSVVCNS